jgi:hypothetical protein
MPVMPEPYGYASVLTRDPAAWARATNARTRSIWRCDVLLIWQ